MVTYFYAALFAVMLTVLAFNVILRRRKHGIGIGTGDNIELARAVRVHGNFTENVPLALILMFLAEDAGTMRWVIHAMGITLVVGRIIHAVALTKSHGTTAGRVIGVVLTSLVMLTGAAICLWFYFHGNDAD